MNNQQFVFAKSVQQGKGFVATVTVSGKSILGFVNLAMNNPSQATGDCIVILADGTEVFLPVDRDTRSKPVASYVRNIDLVDNTGTALAGKKLRIQDGVPSLVDEHHGIPDAKLIVPVFNEDGERQGFRFVDTEHGINVDLGPLAGQGEVPVQSADGTHLYDLLVKDKQAGKSKDVRHLIVMVLGPVKDEAYKRSRDQRAMPMRPALCDARQTLVAVLRTENGWKSYRWNKPTSEAPKGISKATAPAHLQESKIFEGSSDTTMIKLSTELRATYYDLPKVKFERLGGGNSGGGTKRGGRGGRSDKREPMGNTIGSAVGADTMAKLREMVSGNEDQPADADATEAATTGDETGNADVVPDRASM